MKTVTVPMLDHSGELSAIVTDALTKGAKTDHNHADYSTFIMSFDKAADAKAFQTALNAIVSPTAPAGDPVDDQADAPTDG